MSISEDGSSIEKTSDENVSVSSDDISLDFVSVSEDPNDIRIEIYLRTPGLPTIIVTPPTEKARYSEFIDFTDDSYVTCSDEWTLPSEPSVDQAKSAKETRRTRQSSFYKYMNNNDYLQTSYVSSRRVQWPGIPSCAVNTISSSITQCKDVNITVQFHRKENEFCHEMGGDDDKTVECSKESLDSKIENKSPEYSSCSENETDDLSDNGLELYIQVTQILDDRVHNGEQVTLPTVCDVIEEGGDNSHEGGDNSDIEVDEKLQENPKKSYYDDNTEEITSQCKSDNNSKTTHSIDGPFPCQYCGEEFSRKGNLNRHICIDTDDKQYHCELCGIDFKNRNSLTCHKKMIHLESGKTPYKCETCHRVFQNKSLLNRHMNVHLNLKPFVCEVCLKTFTTRSNMKQHKILHSPDNPYKCELCHKYFNKRSNLDHHSLIHTGEKLFPCQLCEKGFMSNCDLQRHMRTHWGVKPFSCDFCQKKFTSNSSLKRHQAMHKGMLHSEDRPYVCMLCEKNFGDAGHLKRHIMLVHTDERPFACGFCENRRFATNDSLIKHMKTHTGEKPFSCGICNRAFPALASLNKHMRIHSGERPYQCKLCDKEFISKYTLRNHMMVHTGDQPFSCEFCDKSFTTNSGRKKHMENHVKQASDVVSIVFNSENRDAY